MSNIRFGYIDVASRQKPGPCEVADLHKVFSDPENLLSSLINIMVNIDPMQLPTIDIEPRLGGRLWRACIKFTWPVAFQVVGESTEQTRARHYAYLEACKMFQNLGLLSSTGQLLDWKSQLENMIEEVMGKLKLRSTLHYSTFQEVTKAKIVWASKLEFFYPFPMSVVGHGVTKCSAETAAAALAFVKLKSMKTLDKNNSSLDSIPSIHLFLKPSRNFISYESSAVQFIPDYEIWVDASKIGYGAYLVTNTKEERTERIRWLKELWPNKIRDLYVVPKHFSSLTEFYALVCAIYTWKKKFEGRSVLIWSDCSYAVTLVNQGLLVNLKAVQNHKYLKLFKILQETCLRYSIDLHCKHIKRMHNQAADSLSKLQMEKFFAMVPNASMKAKKSKKLLFFLPLVDIIPPDKKFRTSTLGLGIQDSCNSNICHYPDIH